MCVHTLFWRAVLRLVERIKWVSQTNCNSLTTETYSLLRSDSPGHSEAKQAFRRSGLWRTSLGNTLRSRCRVHGWGTKIPHAVQCGQIKTVGWWRGPPHFRSIDSWEIQVAPVVNNLPVSAGDVRDTGSIPGSGRSSGVGMAIYSSTLAWRIPWTRGAWWVTAHGAAKSLTGLKRLSTHNQLFP